MTSLGRIIPSLILVGSALLHAGSGTPGSEAAALRPARAATPGQLRELGIRQLNGNRLTLNTDLRPAEEVDSLPRLFDQAVGQWCDYFHVARERASNWHVIGYLMKDEKPFQEAGLVSDHLPTAYHGYAIGNEFWLFEQPSSYYRRHLLLHEATHAFMNAMLGGCGPAWYMEGVAELLATHRVNDGKLLLDVFPDARESVPHWGRIKLVRQAAESGNALSVDQLLTLQPGTDGTSTGYAWVWAFAAFLDGHPRYRDRFRQLPQHVSRADFNDYFRQLYAPDWEDLKLEWAVFVNDLDYGYDLGRAAIEFTPAPGETSGDKRQVMIDASRGWQATGIAVASGTTYQLRAAGEYQIDAGPPAWICEPDGLSIHYCRGKPVGKLLAAVRPIDDQVDAARSFLHPIAVGRGAAMRSSRPGTLYLKINESPAKLGDNQGTLQVTISHSNTQSGASTE